jgi:hypothetical protein
LQNAELMAKGEARAEAPHGSERRRKVRSRKGTIGAQRRIEGKTTTPNLPIKSEFARTTGILLVHSTHEPGWKLKFMR